MERDTEVGTPDLEGVRIGCVSGRREGKRVANVPGGWEGNGREDGGGRQVVDMGTGNERWMWGWDRGVDARPGIWLIGWEGGKREAVYEGDAKCEGDGRWTMDTRLERWEWPGGARGTKTGGRCTRRQKGERTEEGNRRQVEDSRMGQRKGHWTKDLWEAQGWAGRVREGQETGGGLWRERHQT